MLTQKELEQMSQMLIMADSASEKPTIIGVDLSETNMTMHDFLFMIGSKLNATYQDSRVVGTWDAIPLMSKEDAIAYSLSHKHEGLHVHILKVEE